MKLLYQKVILAFLRWWLALLVPSQLVLVAAYVQGKWIPDFLPAWYILGVTFLAAYFAYQASFCNSPWLLALPLPRRRFWLFTALTHASLAALWAAGVAAVIAGYAFLIKFPRQVPQAPEEKAAAAPFHFYDIEPTPFIGIGLALLLMHLALLVNRSSRYRVGIYDVFEGLLIVLSFVPAYYGWLSELCCIILVASVISWCFCRHLGTSFALRHDHWLTLRLSFCGALVLLLAFADGLYLLHGHYGDTRAKAQAYNEVGALLKALPPEFLQPLIENYARWDAEKGSELYERYSAEPLEKTVAKINIEDVLASVEKSSIRAKSFVEGKPSCISATAIDHFRLWLHPRFFSAYAKHRARCGVYESSKVFFSYQHMKLPEAEVLSILEKGNETDIEVLIPYLLVHPERAPLNVILREIASQRLNLSARRMLVKAWNGATGENLQLENVLRAPASIAEGKLEEFACAEVDGSTFLAMANKDSNHERNRKIARCLSKELQSLDYETGLLLYKVTDGRRGEPPTSVYFRFNRETFLAARAVCAKNPLSFFCR